ncbi:MAG TPA: MarR family transcriptional regulator [Solirubrobacterales bacterium]|nr:MarR family transcriptional regulator [Solirubrobacterales bacterium]
MQARLSPDELGAWRGFLQTHARLTRQLDDELRSEHDLPLTTYDVLVQLENAPGHQMRMSELADAVLLSRSGLTRLVDRLERQGLLERRECPDDARGSLAALTDAGAARLAEARPTHLAGVRRLFLEPLGKPERRQMAAVWEQLSRAGGP